MTGGAGAENETGGKPNPLAGFGRVGCGVFMVGKAPTATGLALYRALAQSANSKKDCAGKSVWSERKRTGVWLGAQFAQKKEDRLCGESVFF